MYVCICKSVTDRHIHAAVRGGVISFHELRMETGVSTCCGRCSHEARRVFAEALGDQFPAQPAGISLPGAPAFA